MPIPVNDLIHKPFKDGGRGPDDYDCSGLMMEVMRRAGTIIPDYGNGISCNDTKNIHDAIYKAEPEWEPIKKIKQGCLIVLSYSVPGWASHVGVAIGGDSFIHTRSATGVKVDHISSPAWRKRVMGYYIYKGNVSG